MKERSCIRCRQRQATWKATYDDEVTDMLCEKCKSKDLLAYLYKKVEYKKLE
jgi:hypothetical protein